ncbi:MAG: STAS/SEC14 domain-containing protein [Bacteroidetes bacterium]|nr:STAS/SEC14 domain-containing protein [Bacteroidota bacterium]
MGNVDVMEDVVVIIDNDYVKATYIPKHKLVTVTWHGQVSSENYRGTYNTVLDYQKSQMDKMPVTNFMADIRNQGVVNPSDRKWFEEVAIQRAISQGLKKTAVVTDANVFKKYYLNLILKATNKFGLPLKLVATPEDAIEFFKSA